MLDGDITFRDLAYKDMPLLHRWLNAPHMRAHYQRLPMTLDEVIAKYTPRIDGRVDTHCHIALLDDKPFGKIQCFSNAVFPDFSADIILDDGISLDIFIGEGDMLGQGLGPRMLRAYLKDVAFRIFGSETHCYICHATDNPAAIRSSLKAGFRFLRDVIEAEAPAKLFVIDKESL